MFQMKLSGCGSKRGIRIFDVGDSPLHRELSLTSQRAPKAAEKLNITICSGPLIGLT